MNVLFITSTRVGDAILSSGLLNHIITHNNNPQVTIACGRAASPLFRAVPNLQKIIILDKMLFSLHWLQLLLLCIGKHWDLVVDLRNAPVTYLLSCSRRLGMPRGRGNTRRVKMLARVLDLESVAPPHLWVGDSEKGIAAKLIPNTGSVLAVGPTANWRAKTWRVEYFSDLIHRLTSHNGIFPGAKVAVFGRDDERPMVLRLIEEIPKNRRIDLVGKIDLLTAYACLGRCSFYVGNDSGLMHLAAASGLPTLGLFGPTQETVYAPWGKNSGFVRTKISIDKIFPSNFDHRTSETLMDSLTVEMAEEGAIKLWKRSQEQNT